MSLLRQSAAIVIGDLMLDRYLYGHVARISPEAPVPVVQLDREDCRPGGAANVAASLAALGLRVSAAGIVGCDREAEELRQSLESFGTIDALFERNPEARTICKTRVLAAGRQQVVRLDRDGDYEQFSRSSAALCERVVPLIRKHNVVVVADYDKGAVDEATIQRVIAEAKGAGIPCIVDPKKRDFGAYAGALLITPNLFELERACKELIRTEAELHRIAKELRDRHSIDYVLVTRGADGMTLVGEGAPQHFPAAVREVADVSGAGDTVVATIAAALGSQWTLEEACRLASAAAGIAVSHSGTYVVRSDELEGLWEGRSPKITNWDTARRRIAAAQERGHRVVFTNGCFDLLHAGHLSSLERARKCGDMLVVGLNTDASVRMNKGPTRPVISERHRAQMLAGLGCVDMVVLFDDDTPEELIRHIAPDVLIKGADCANRQIPGADFIRERGGEVILLSLVDGLSTTEILRIAKS